MEAQHIDIAQASLDVAHEGSLSFPEIVGMLAEAGFESYLVDYRCETQTFYRSDSGHVVLPRHLEGGAVSADFQAVAIAGLVAWARENGPDYSYREFGARTRAAGCAGYLVSMPGRRAVYFGRSGETHVEHFPR